MLEKRDEKLYERNKEINQLEWVKLMNNYKNTAEEISTEVMTVEDLHFEN